MALGAAAAALALQSAVLRPVSAQGEGDRAAAGASSFYRRTVELSGRGELDRGEFGWSVAVSASGGTLAVGASNDDSPPYDSPNGVLSQGLGAAWVFSSSGTGWTRGTKLVARAGLGPGQFGNAVALSANGTTLLVGAPAANAGIGAVWVFSRRGGDWRQQGPALTVPRAGTAGFGSSVALSASGTTALVGGASADGGIGAAWVFVRTETGWHQSAQLAGAGEKGSAEFGRRVALSATGATALIGGPGDDGGVGAVWTFARSRTGWRQQAGKLSPGGRTAAAFGSSLALTASGKELLVGAPVSDDGLGEAWFFTASGGAWKRQGAALQGEGEAGAGQFGDAVALSSAGTRALVGGATDGQDAGAVWAFARAGSAWRQLGSKLLSGEAQREPVEFGDSLALSGDGTIGLVGGLGAADDVGAAWVLHSDGPG